MTTPDSAPAWDTIRPQTGPVATGGPGTLRSTYQQLKADPNVHALAAGVDAAHPQDEAFRGIRTTVGSLRAGAAYGKQVGQSWVGAGQAQPADAADSGQQYGNGDGGGEELATRSDLQAHTDTLTGKIDALASSASSGQAGVGGGQAQGQQSRSPQSILPRESPLVGQARAHQQALESMVASHQNLASVRQNQAAHFAQRQQAAQGVRVAPAASAIGMSADYAQRSFYGQQGSGNGTSANTWESSRWSR